MAETYAKEKYTDNTPTYRIDSPSFGSTIRKLAVFTRTASLLLTDDDIKEIRSQLHALADLSGHKERVWLQVADIGNGVEIDLGDAAHMRAACNVGRRNTAEVKSSRSLFYRTSNMAPFAMPSDRGQPGRTSSVPQL